MNESLEMTAVKSKKHLLDTSWLISWHALRETFLRVALFFKDTFGSCKTTNRSFQNFGGDLKDGVWVGIWVVDTTTKIYFTRPVQDTFEKYLDTNTSSK